MDARGRGAPERSMSVTSRELCDVSLCLKPGILSDPGDLPCCRDTRRSLSDQADGTPRCHVVTGAAGARLAASSVSAREAPVAVASGGAIDGRGHLSYRDGQCYVGRGGDPSGSTVPASMHLIKGRGPLVGRCRGLLGYRTPISEGS